MTRSLRFGLGIAGLCATLFAGASQAATIRHDVSQAAYQLIADDYPSVGQVTAYAGSGAWSGSGTLVAGRWMITAAHVLDDARAVSFDIGGRTYNATGWYLAPGWNGNLLGGNDIAVVKFGTSIAAETGITPMTRFRGTSVLGRRAVFVGFGRTGTGITGDTAPYTGVKLGHRNRIDASGRYLTDSSAGDRILLADFDSPAGNTNLLGSATPEAREGIIAPGDSGGAVILNVNGSARLAGVHSFLFPNGTNDFDPNSDYGDASGHTRLSSFNTWIEDVFAGDLLATMIRPNLTLTSTSMAAGAAASLAAVPEPGSLLLAAGGLLVLLSPSRRAGRA